MKLLNHWFPLIIKFTEILFFFFKASWLLFFQQELLFDGKQKFKTSSLLAYVVVETGMSSHQRMWKNPGL